MSSACTQATVPPALLARPQGTVSAKQTLETCKRVSVTRQSDIPSNGVGLFTDYTWSRCERGSWVVGEAIQTRKLSSPHLSTDWSNSF
ncbi:hypothetical protein J6590_036562 [Homalodisca vitripennis]|nr:hypothetical protein J6590_036562 [Homalodisca vitripennis]